MDISVFDKEGDLLGRRQLNSVPAKGDIVLLPPLVSDAPTVEMNVAELSKPLVYKVLHVVWDMTGGDVKLVVERTDIPGRFK